MTVAQIKEEITVDPLGRGYSSMTDQQVTDNLNIKDRTRNLNEISGDVVFDATNPTEFAALSEHKQVLWLSFCGRGTIDPFGSANVAFVQWVFGSGATTISNLATIRTQTISRGEEIGHGLVRIGAVTQARM